MEQQSAWNQGDLHAFMDGYEVSEDTSIKGYRANVKLHIRTLWNERNNYGPTVYTDEVELVKKVK